MTTAHEPIRFHHSHPIPEHPAEDLSLDQQLALKSAAERLGTELAGIYGTETIQRSLLSSYEEFAERATVANYLPLLAERFARQRLHALARVEGHLSDGQPVVLFLCTHEVNPAAVAAMSERIDISSEYPKPWTDEVVRAADVVITMGCVDACPIFPGKRYEDWDVLAPPGSTRRPSDRSATSSNPVCWT